MASNNARWNALYWHFLIYSKAYDTVWREKLLLHMLDAGISPISIRWIRSFFNDCRARIQLFNVFSSSQRFTQDLPQASILALFYINNLASSLNDDAVIAVFADDVSILTTARKKEDAETVAQSLVNTVINWSKEWKLSLNADKNEVCPFSTWSNDSTWTPTIFIGTQKVCVNTTPCFLSVILDKSLTFDAHLKKLTVSLSTSICIIRATAHHGFSCSNLQQVQLSYHNVYQTAAASVVGPTNYLPFYHPNFNIIKASTIFHLDHGSLKPLVKNILLQLFMSWYY